MAGYLTAGQVDDGFMLTSPVEYKVEVVSGDSTDVQLQEALDRAEENYGLFVVIDGQCILGDTVTIPTTAGGQPIPIVICGYRGAAGINTLSGFTDRRAGGSILGKGLGDDTPMLTWATGEDAVGHWIMGLTILREDEGPVIEFDGFNGGPDGGDRWRRGGIKDCRIHAAVSTDTSRNSIWIRGAWNCVLEDVIVSGGYRSVWLDNSPRTDLVRVISGSKGGSKRLIHLDTCGNNNLINCRSEGETEYGVRISDTNNVNLFSFSSEGHEESSIIEVEDSHGVHLFGPNIGGFADSASDRVGIRFKTGSKHCRIFGGTYPSFPANQYAVDVESGADFIQGEGLDVQDDGDIRINAACEESHIKAYYEQAAGDFIPYHYTGKRWQTMVQNNNNILFDGVKATASMCFQGNGTFKGVDTGQYDGQRIRIQFNNTSQVNHNDTPSDSRPNIQLQTGANWTSINADSQLELEWDEGADYWFEVWRLAT